MANNNFRFSKKRRIASSYKISEENSTSFKLTKIFKRELALTMMSIVGVTLVMLGGSYSIFSQITRADDANVLRTGTLALEFNDTEEGLGNIISLNGDYPITDQVGIESKTPYTFKITNTGSLNASYQIKILDDSGMIDEDGCIDNLLRKEVIRYSIDGEAPAFLSTASDGVIKTGNLAGGTSETHSIKMWISDVAENTDLGKHYHGKILVEAIQGDVAAATIKGLPYIEVNKIYKDLSNNDKQDMNKIRHNDGTIDYRYIGLNPNNYITFNGENAGWRIIGVTSEENSEGKKEQRIKIIRNSSIGNMAWNSTNSNSWDTASSIKNVLGNSINSDQIESMKWHTGGIDSTITTTTEQFYAYEVNSSTWSGTVGLPYISDFGYTFSNGVNDGCYTALADINKCGINAANSWMFNSGNGFWSISPLSGNVNSVYAISSDGTVSTFAANSSNIGVLPVVYLKSNINITGGIGTQDNPYTIS